MSIIMICIVLAPPSQSRYLQFCNKLDKIDERQFCIRTDHKCMKFRYCCNVFVAMKTTLALSQTTKIVHLCQGKDPVYLERKPYSKAAELN
jgi:hypothetical protein